ncbi:MAG: GNAT family N-acetyltransferase [Clostridia bacterium]|nr:GNAT family N-acetyltransferase [Clostridia bacterium]
MVELKAITKDNFEDVISLKVSEHQQAFVSSTVHSLAQAYVYRDTAFPFAIYADDTLVGFIMLGFYEEKKQYTLWKFLIDNKYQNHGYGKKALKMGIEYLITTFGAKEIYVGVSSENDIAKQLYSSVGFKQTGLIENNTEEMKYVCQR